MDRQQKDSAEYEISEVDIVEYLPKIYETASKCLNDPELIQDAVGEVYERLSRQPKVSTRDKLKAYIDVTTRNMCSTIRKRKYRLAARAVLFSRLESAAPSQNTPLANFLAGSAIRPDEVAALKEKLALVRSAIVTAILKLNARDFDMLRRRYFADKPETIEEIARALQLSVSVVKNRIHEARSHFISEFAALVDASTGSAFADA